MAEQPETEPPQAGFGRRKSHATIDMLVETRRRASDEHERAQRAERAYRTRKNAKIARTALSETKMHFSEGFKHLGLGLKGLIPLAKGVPYLVSEKRDAWRKKQDAKKRARAEEMKKKLEESLERKYTDEGDDGKERDDEKSEANGKA